MSSNRRTGWLKVAEPGWRIYTSQPSSGRTQKSIQNAKTERPILAHLCQNQNGPVGPCDLQRLTLQICECDSSKSMTVVWNHNRHCDMYMERRDVQHVSHIEGHDS